MGRWLVSGTIAILVFAVGLHYTLEYMSNPGNSDYSCPPYCEVDHEHVISKNKGEEWSYKIWLLTISLMMRWKIR